MRVAAVVRKGVAVTLTEVGTSGGAMQRGMHGAAARTLLPGRKRGRRSCTSLCQAPLSRSIDLFNYLLIG